MVCINELSPEQVARFWSKVAVKGHYECWLWRAVKTKRGYGGVMILDRHYGAHRIAYQIFNGPIPDGMRVCHKCDTPDCVNPFHLFLGTQKDNIQDAIQKGRMKFTPRALSDSQESEVLAADFGQTRQLAEKFGVSRKTVARVRARDRQKLPAE